MSTQSPRKYKVNSDAGASDHRWTEGILSGLQSLLGGKTTRQAPGERVDLDPLNYLLPKVKPKHIYITNYVQTIGQEVEEVLSGSGDRQIILKICIWYTI